MRQAKEFKNYHEQLEILNKKGLITDENSIKILRRNNYYFLINRYRNLFTIPNVKPNTFIKGTHFNELVATYEFDRDLRMLLLKYIITIENTMKSLISYWFASSHGNKYLTADVFDTLNNSPRRVRSIKSLINTISSTIKKGIKDKKYIKHYYENYTEVPIWVVINDLSLSSTSKFYSFMYPKDQDKVASEFNISNASLDCYLKVLTFFRNLAAHNQRIFDERSPEKISRTVYHQKLNTNNGENDILALMIIFKQLLDKKDFKHMYFELSEIITTLDENVNTIDINDILNKMGFNENWKKLNE